MNTNINPELVKNKNITFKNFRYSYVFLIITIMLFSTSFLSHTNPIMTTLIFLIIVNLTCFSNEYLVIKYFQSNPQKNSNKGYALFVAIQTLITLILFLVFRLYF